MFYMYLNILIFLNDYISLERKSSFSHQVITQVHKFCNLDIKFSKILIFCIFLNI